MKAHISLFGTSFSLHSDEDSQYIDSLVEFIKTKIELVDLDVSVEDQLKKAILTLLLITHEYNMLKKDLRKNQHSSLQSLQNIISELEFSNNTSDGRQNGVADTRNNIRFVDIETNHR